jgi:predicted glycogen debranching enzyme
VAPCPALVPARFDDEGAPRVSETIDPPAPSKGEGGGTMTNAYSDRDEWLEPDGLGGFASGTATGIRTRRYHALLLAATTPPTGRVVLVNGFDAWVETANGIVALTSQRYQPGVVHPDGAQRVSAFTTDPWPRWTFSLGGDLSLEQSIVVQHGAPLVAISWQLTSRAAGSPARLFVRPFLSGRDYHSMHHENEAFAFEPERLADRLIWRPYDGIPAIHVVSNGEYRHEPEWYRNFRYDAEAARGLDASEDLAAPGVFSFDLTAGDAALIVAAAPDAEAALPSGQSAREVLARVQASERARRQAFASPLHRAADAYLVTRGTGATIVAGYPWFTDWGRDTFIALRGICLAADRLDDARRILLEWSGAISEGMLPNRFPDRGEAPEFNAVDASLWFAVAVHDLFERAGQLGQPLPSSERAALEAAVDAILSGYAAGTRFGIRLDDDGLLAAGQPGVQLTWMDAKVGDQVITPRIGKPVEVQALWLNALSMASAWSPRWASLFARGRAAFEARFWNEASGTLYDVVDVDHRAGTVDPALRPNQIFAIGGLPVTLVSEERARRALTAVESQLLTPIGLRSLAPGEAGYIGRYGGGVAERDGAYHQGTVWPWLLTPFVEAWIRAHGGGPAAKAEARDRFLAPLLRHLDEHGLGHVSEIADGDTPHAPNGCPFQAWSVGELLRLDRLVLATAPAAARNRRRTRASKRVEEPLDALGAR